jgi:hypothetical protein
MDVVPGGMLGGGLPVVAQAGDVKGRSEGPPPSATVPSDRRDVRDTKEGVPDRACERARDSADRDRERERDGKKPTPTPPGAPPTPASSSRVPGVSPKDKITPGQVRDARDREREREREREIYAAAIAGGSGLAPGSVSVGTPGARRLGEGQDPHPPTHSRQPSLSSQQRERERYRDTEREPEGERETRRHQQGPSYPLQYTERERERDRDRDHPGITLINSQQPAPPPSRDGDAEMGYGYSPHLPPHHMGPPSLPPPGWRDPPPGMIPMEMGGYHPNLPGYHQHSHHHHQPHPSQSAQSGYHPQQQQRLPGYPPPPPPPGSPPGPYGPSGPLPPSGYGPLSTQQQHFYDDRSIGPAEVNPIHHGSNGGPPGHLHPAGMQQQQQQQLQQSHSPRPAPQQPQRAIPSYNGPTQVPAYVSVPNPIPAPGIGLDSGVIGPVVPAWSGSLPSPVLPIPVSTLRLTATSALEPVGNQPELVHAAAQSALLYLERDDEFERKADVRAKTCLRLGTFVYPDVPFPYQFDVGASMPSKEERNVVVQEKYVKGNATLNGREMRKEVDRRGEVPSNGTCSEQAQKANQKRREDGMEEGEILAAPVGDLKDLSATKEFIANRETPSVIPPSQEIPASFGAFATMEAELDAATTTEPIIVDVETRVTIIIPYAHLPAEKPKRLRIWGGGIALPAAYLRGHGGMREGRLPPKIITRQHLLNLLPPPPPSQPPIAPAPVATPIAAQVESNGEEKEAYIPDHEPVATNPLSNAYDDNSVAEVQAHPRREEGQAELKARRSAYLSSLESAGDTILRKYAPRRIYTDDSDLALCAIHSGWVSWAGMKQAKTLGRDLQVEVRVIRVAKLGVDSQWSDREIGKISHIYPATGKDVQTGETVAGKQRVEEIVTRFVGGLGERCWLPKGQNGWVEIGESTLQMDGRYPDMDSGVMEDGRSLMSAAWGTGHSGAAIEILAAKFVEVCDIPSYFINYIISASNFCPAAARNIAHRARTWKAKSSPTNDGICRTANGYSWISSHTTPASSHVDERRLESTDCFIAHSKSVELYEYPSGRSETSTRVRMW